VHGIDHLAPSDGRLFVVVGVFDGLHLGHAYLLEHLRAEAQRRGARPAVITFDHHPDEILTGAAPPLLLDPEERLERLEAAGVDVTVVEVFDVALRMTPFDRFVGRIADRVDLAGFLMTPDSAFGHDRGGTPQTVAALGLELGYDVAVVPALEIDGRAVRSAEIRAALAAGDVAEAERLLGHPYAIVGSAQANETGRSAGDGAGAADAILRVPMPVALPPAGEYAVRIEVAGGSPGVAGAGAATRIGAPRAATVERDGLARIDADGAIRVRDLAGRTGSTIRITFGERSPRLPLQGSAGTIRRS
jgi:riboflavin kinase/FMN adenylyltransferase